MMLPNDAVFVSTQHDDADGDPVATTGRSPAETNSDDRTQGEIENLVRVIWEDVLDTRPIDTHTDYHSLNRGMQRALRILARIEEATGVELPLSIYSTSPTIGGMANAILGRDRASSDPVIPLKQGSADAPLFFLPGLGGLVFELFHLVRSLDYPGSIYGLQPQGIDGRHAPHRRIEEMAEAYVGILKRVQPDGPFRLVGYCLGGCIALEVARRLSADGRHVAFLGLIESPLHERSWPLSIWLHFRAGRVLAKVSARAAGPRRSPAMPLAGTPTAPLTNDENINSNGGDIGASRMQVILKKMSTHPGYLYARRHLIQKFYKGCPSVLIKTSPYYIGELPLTFQRVRDAQINSLVEYAPLPYPGKVVYFKTPIGDTFTCDPRVVWPRIATNIVWRDFDGDHQSMLRQPHVGNNARQLLACLMSDSTPMQA